MASAKRIEQDGCHNCEQVFIKTEWDEPDAYFCTLNALPRPPCQSCFMEGERLEWPSELPDNAPWKDTPWGIWDARAKGREVNPWTICGAHEGKT